MTKEEILQLINNNITIKTAPNSITPVILGDTLTEVVNFTGDTNLWVSGSSGTNSITTFANTINFKGNVGDATGDYSVAMGGQTLASGVRSHAQGYTTIASGDNSHAEGFGTNASGFTSHAQGINTTATGYASHAEGQNTTASGYVSHAEGSFTTASGYYSHAEGSRTTASGDVSHAEGSFTTASGYYSHAEGSRTTASGDGSHAEGSNTIASGNYSHAGGFENTAHSYCETSIGVHGTNYTPASTTSFDSSDRLFNIGNGAANNARSDAFTIFKNGGVLFHPTTTPINPTAGMVYYDQVSNILRCYNGTEWKDLFV